MTGKQVAGAHVVVEADGGSRGNPGPAGYGAVVFDTDGGVLAERCAALGETTNNVAEYSGLIAGLTAARELGASTVDIRMDSKLVVEQLSGRWKIKNEALRELAAQARELLDGFAGTSLEWIPRERNAHADRLANLAMDAQARGETPELEPSTVDESGPAVPAVSESTEAPAISWTGVRTVPTRLLLLRHGQTALSVQRRYSGRGNPELTELGLRQAKAAAARLSTVESIDAVLCSPLRRARQTAEEAATARGLDVTVHEDLIELDFGDWEGLSFAEAAERDPAAHAAWIADPLRPVPGGESIDAVQRRIAGLRDTLLAERAGQTVLLVSHVTPIKAMLRLGLDVGPTIYYRLHLDLASLSVVDFYPDGAASVRLINETSYLN